MTGRRSQLFLNDNVISHATQMGIARYFRNVASGVISHFGRDVIICSPEVRDYGMAKYVWRPRFRGSWRIGFNDWFASLMAYLEHASVVFSPYYGSMRTAAAEVFTVHDMIYELFPQYFARENAHVARLLTEKRLCLERAAALIAISDSTAQDILKCCPHVNPKKITIVHYGVDDFFFDPPVGSCEVQDGKPYLLFVGNRELYKNFTKLLVAFAQSGLAKDLDLRVISPPGKGFGPGEREYLNRYHLDGCVHLTMSPPQPVLREAYAKAVALVYPSEYEGFGLPILEAMAAGTLVCASATSSMPEVGGDVGLYFDPCDPESIAECLRQAVDLASEERRERIQRGIVRAHTFTWERCQRQTIQVLKGLL